MLLDSRLRHVVDEIHDSHCTIDVGTDHGKVILTALSEGRCEMGIASDISAPSLAKARELADKMNIPLDTRCGDGLAVLHGEEADTAVIAGMGGKEIVKILSEHPVHIERLILVPHRDAREVRCWLNANIYHVTRDYMVHENGHFYPIIVAEIGVGEMSEREMYFGKGNMDDDVFRAYISYRLGVLEGIREKTDKANIDRELDLIHEIMKTR